MWNKAVTNTKTLFKGALENVKIAEKALGPASKVPGYFYIGMVAAPFVFANDERDPIETSLITTPVLAGALAATPVAREIFRRGGKTGRAVFTNALDFRRMFKEADLPAFLRFKTQVDPQHWQGLEEMEGSIRTAYYRSHVPTAADKQAELLGKKEQWLKTANARLTHLQEMYTADRSEEVRLATAAWRDAAIAVVQDPKEINELKEAALPETPEKAMDFIQTLMKRHALNAETGDPRFLKALASRLKHEGKLKGVAFEDGKMVPVAEMKVVKQEGLKKLAERATTEGTSETLQLLRANPEYHKLATEIEHAVTRTKGPDSVTAAYDKASGQIVGLNVSAGGKHYNIGVTNRKTREVLTGPEFFTQGAGTRGIVVGKGNALEYLEADEMFFRYLGTGQMTDEELAQNYRRFTSWHHGFGEVDAKGSHYGTFQREIFGSRSALVEGKVHWKKGSDDLHSYDDYNIENQKALLETRVKAGEAPSSGEGSLNNLNMYGDAAQDVELSQQMAKSTTMQRSVMKQMQPFAMDAANTPSVMTAELQALMEKHGLPGVGVNMTAGGFAPTHAEFFGVMSRIAMDDGVAIDKGELFEQFKKTDIAEGLKVAENQLDLANRQVRKAFDNWAGDRIRNAFTEAHYTDPNKLAKFQKGRQEAINLFKKSATGFSDEELERRAAAYFEHTARQFAADPVKLRAAAGLGSAAGEGQRMVRASAYRDVWLGSDQEFLITNPNVDLKSLLAVDEEGTLRKNWKDYLIEEGRRLGTSADPSLSFVTTANRRNLLMDATEVKDGMFRVVVRSVHNFADADLKTDMMGNKGGNVRASEKTFTRAIDMLADITEQTGGIAGGNISRDVTSLEGIFHNTLDAQVTSEHMLNQAGQVLEEADRLMRGSKESQAVFDESKTTILKTLREDFGILPTAPDLETGRGFGFRIKRREFEQKAVDYFSQAHGIDARDVNVASARMWHERNLRVALLGQNASDKLEKLPDIPLLNEGNQNLVGQLEKCMERVADSVSEEELFRRSETFGRARRWQRFTADKGISNRFVDYLHTYHARSTATAWESSQHNAARSIRMTEDFYRSLERQGYNPIIRELIGRQVATGSGNPEGASAVWDWIMKGDFSKPPEDAHVVDVDTMAKLSGDGTGSLLDWRRQDLQDPFWVRLPKPVTMAEGEEKIAYQYVPHVGYSGLGSGINRYNSKLDAAKHAEYSKGFDRLVRSIATDAPESEAVVAEDMRTFMHAHTEFVGGKGGMLRAKVIDPAAVFGRPQHISSTTEGAFDLFVTEDMFDRMLRKAPQHIREQAETSNMLYAAHHRHPINQVTLVRVRRDKSLEKAGILAKNQIGMSDTMRLVTRGDFDFDPGALSPLFESDSIALAKSQIEDTGSIQWKKALQTASLRNVEDNHNLTMAYMEKVMGGKSYADKAVDISKYTYGHQIEALKNRLAGRYIGQYSNLVTRLQLGMEKHPGFEMPTDLFDPEYGLFAWQQPAEDTVYSVRQLPISLRKSKGGSLDDPLKHLKELSDAYATGGEEGSDRFVHKLIEIADRNNEKSVWNADLAERYKGILNHEPNEEVNVMKELLEKNEVYQQRLKQLVLGRRAEVAGLAESAERLKELTRVKDLLLRDIDGKKFTNPQTLWDVRRTLMDSRRFMSTHMASAGFASEADKLATQMGAYAEMVKMAAKEGKAALKPSGKPILAGLIAASVASMVLSGSPDSMKAAAPRSPSARPEEQIGVTDQIPGAPETGYMSDHPQREFRFRNGGVNRTVVAPMRRTDNTVVEISSPDQGILNRLRRGVADNASGGDTFVTNNYHGGWKDGASRLRTREHIREDLDRY